MTRACSRNQPQPSFWQRVRVSLLQQCDYLVVSNRPFLVDYIKYAQKALLLDGQGGVLTTTDISTLNLPADYTAKLAVSEKLTTQNYGVQEQELVESVAGCSLHELHKDTMSHLQFLFKSTKLWPMVLGLISCVALSIIDHSPSKSHIALF